MPGYNPFHKGNSTMPLSLTKMRLRLLGAIVAKTTNRWERMRLFAEIHHIKRLERFPHLATQADMRALSKIVVLAIPNLLYTPPISDDGE